MSYASRPLVEHLEPRRLFAADVPDGFIIDTIAGGLDFPTAMVQALDGRIFVAEQGGEVRVIKDDALLPTPFATLAVESILERGLLGLELDPDFANNGYVYVYYTAELPTAHNRVSRLTADGDVVLAGSELVLLELDPPVSGIHNGGAMHFGPDGKLYIGVGEDSVGENAQRLDTFKGKLLRINSDGSIPTDNPFYNTASGDYRSIWALGLRNPFTFAFQPGTGRLFINDVGSAAFEEINEGVAGGNYGWPLHEGPFGSPDYVEPLYVYGRDDGFAIAGGAFYNPAVESFPADYSGDYFFGDVVFNYVSRFDPLTNTVTPFATGLSGPLDLDVTAGGHLLFLDHGEVPVTGRVGRIRYAPTDAPSITVQPAGAAVPPGETHILGVDANGPGTLSYQWQKEGVDLPGQTLNTLTLANATDAHTGLYRVIVSSEFGTAVSREARITVIANEPPKPRIIWPLSGSRYFGGKRIVFVGRATDAEDGVLPASAFTWQVNFRHNTHTHPFMPPTSGMKRGSFVIPRIGETATDVFYRVFLTVTDSTGATVTVQRDITPRLVTITMTANVPEARFTLDGHVQDGLLSFTTVAGLRREIGVVAPDGYEFRRWSAGVRNTTRVIHPMVSRGYRMVFSAVPVASLSSLSDEQAPTPLLSLWEQEKNHESHE